MGTGAVLQVSQIGVCLFISMLSATTPAFADALQIFEINPNAGFPPNDITEFDILVEPDPSCPIVVDIDVGVMIPHTWQGDLKLILTHTDSGNSTVLFDRPGSPQDNMFGFSADNYGNPETGELFFLDDEADELYDSRPFGNVPSPGIPNVTGNWIPEGSLAVFDGLDASGVWRLRIEDNGGADVGALNTLALYITTGPNPIPEPSPIAVIVLASICCVCLRPRFSGAN